MRWIVLTLGLMGVAGCALLPSELGPAAVAVNADIPVDPASSTLHLVVNERACASGRAPTNRAVRVTVEESDQLVEIRAQVAGVRGGAECPSNPWHPVTVTLDGPLGTRELRDLDTGELLGAAIPGEHL